MDGIVPVCRCDCRAQASLGRAKGRSRQRWYRKTLGGAV